MKRLILFISLAIIGHFAALCKVYTAVEQAPKFPGGDAELIKWVSNHIEYPAEAVENDIQGYVTVQFVVRQDGTADSVKVVRGLTDEINREAIRVISSLPQFTPARMGGKAVDCWYTLNVKFSLPAANIASPTKHHYSTSTPGKTVTKFLGIPVDGSKQQIIDQLITKGFKPSGEKGTGQLKGIFNGYDVNIDVATENGKVTRIVVTDATPVSELDIKMRFNQLCRQFKNNGKYIADRDYTIPEDERIRYNFADKFYDAVFYQLPEDDSISKRLVWFRIKRTANHKYFIVMFYENRFNRADGEDL